MIVKKLNVNLSEIDLSKIDRKTDDLIRKLAREKKMAYIVAANAVLVNQTLLNYGGAS